MGRRRGVARTSFPRRRVFRVIAKWSEFSVPRRFKLLAPRMVDELDWEIEVLLRLEEKVFSMLENQGVPSDLWPYYIAFTKRIWNRQVHFGQETYLLEKTSLVTEFTQRGLAPGILGLIQLDAEAMAREKLWILNPPVWSYDWMVGKIWMAEPEGESGGSYDWTTGAIYVPEPEGYQGGYYDNRT